MSEATLQEQITKLAAEVAQLRQERSAKPVTGQVPWRSLSIQIESAAAVATVLRASAGAWAAAGVDARELCGIVTAQESGQATVCLWGQWAVAGTVGTAYYPGASGALVTDVSEDHQPWPIAYQITPTMRFVVGLLPRLTMQEVTVCADLGEGEATMPAHALLELEDE